MKITMDRYQANRGMVELGLVNTKDMFKKAMAGGYAVPAYNFNNMAQLQGIIKGCVESKSPVILQVSGSAGKAGREMKRRRRGASCRANSPASAFTSRSTAGRESGQERLFVRFVACPAQRVEWR